METYRELFLEPQFNNIPDTLRALPWAVWRAEPRLRQTGKFDKAPRCPTGGHRIGANNPELFGTFQQACDAYKSGQYTGVGVLLGGGGIVGIDIDNASAELAANPGLGEWLKEATQQQAYCEYSPSRTGVRLFIKGGPLPDERKRKAGNLEIYDSARFLTVTGHLIKSGNTDA